MAALNSEAEAKIRHCLTDARHAVGHAFEAIGRDQLIMFEGEVERAARDLFSAYAAANGGDFTILFEAVFKIGIKYDQS